MADRATGAEATRRALARLGLAVPVANAAARVEGHGERLSVSLRADEGSGPWVPAHASEPAVEARALVDHALGGRPMPPIAVVFGVGVGYVIEDLLGRAPTTRVLAVELAPELLPAFCARRDWTPWLDRRQLIVTAVPDVRPDLSSWPDADFLEGPLVIVVPSIAQHRVRALSEAYGAWRQMAFERRANAEARRAFAAPYVRHTLANVPHVIAEGDVTALDGIAGGAPIVICAAGPSLDRVASELAPHRGHVFVMAADTAVRPLVHAGVEPDLIVAVDPTTLNGRHLLDLPRLRRSYLVAEPSLDPRAVHPFAGRTFFGRIGRFHPWPWLESQGVACGMVEVWGSVLTAACTLARRLGTGPVVFAGTDLAYSGGQPYCRHTTFEIDWEAQAERDGISLEEVWRRRLPGNGVDEADVHGQPVRTAPHLVAFRNWVRTFVARHPERTFVNASGSGILHGDGIAQATLDTVLGTLDGEVDVADRLAAAHSARPAPPAALGPALQALAVADDTTAPLADWLSAAPGLGADDIRRAATSAAARSARIVHGGVDADDSKDSTTMQTAPEWIDVAHDPATYLAKAPMAWEVPESAVRTLAYVRHGKTLTLSFTITGSILHGGGVNELYLRIPDHHVAARSCVNAIWIGSYSYREAGYARTHAGLDVVVLFRASEAPFGPDPGGFSVFGQITFEVQ